MKKLHIGDFFRPFDQYPLFGSVDYAKVENFIQAADAFSRSSHQCIYIIDYYKRGFLYVSDNPLFLCGETAASVLQSGYQFYFRHVPARDLDMLLDINEAGFNLYKTIPVADRLSYSISYDFHLTQPAKTSMLINHKLTPLALDAQSNIWLALCAITHSSGKGSGNVVVSKKDGSKVFEYDLAAKEWKPRDKVLLSIREKEILALSMQGFTMKEIAEKLFISLETVKFHRKSIFQKLKAKNTSEAISYAINYGIF